MIFIESPFYSAAARQPQEEGTSAHGRQYTRGISSGAASVRASVSMISMNTAPTSAEWHKVTVVGPENHPGHMRDNKPHETDDLWPMPRPPWRWRSAS